MSAEPAAVPHERCDAWNRAHPVGSPVTCTFDDGRTLDTTTRSEAYLLSRTPVVFLVGVVGCYAMERVKPRVEPAKESPCEAN